MDFHTSVSRLPFFPPRSIAIGSIVLVLLLRRWRLDQEGTSHLRIASAACVDRLDHQLDARGVSWLGPCLVEERNKLFLESVFCEGNK